MVDESNHLTDKNLIIVAPLPTSTKGCPHNVLSLVALFCDLLWLWVGLSDFFFAGETMHHFRARGFPYEIDLKETGKMGLEDGGVSKIPVPPTRT